MFITYILFQIERLDLGSCILWCVWLHPESAFPKKKTSTYSAYPIYCVINTDSRIKSHSHRLFNHSQICVSICCSRSIYYRLIDVYTYRYRSYTVLSLTILWILVNSASKTPYHHNPSTPSLTEGSASQQRLALDPQPRDRNLRTLSPLGRWGWCWRVGRQDCRDRRDGASAQGWSGRHRRNLLERNARNVWVSGVHGGFERVERVKLLFSKISVDECWSFLCGVSCVPMELACHSLICSSRVKSDRFRSLYSVQKNWRSFSKTMHFSSNTANTFKEKTTADGPTVPIAASITSPRPEMARHAALQVWSDWQCVVVVMADVKGMLCYHHNNNNNNNNNNINICFYIGMYVCRHIRM